MQARRGDPPHPPRRGWLYHPASPPVGGGTGFKAPTHATTRASPRTPLDYPSVNLPDGAGPARKVETSHGGSGFQMARQGSKLAAGLPPAIRSARRPRRPGPHDEGRDVVGARFGGGVGVAVDHVRCEVDRVARLEVDDVLPHREPQMT